MPHRRQIHWSEYEPIWNMREKSRHHEHVHHKHLVAKHGPLGRKGGPREPEQQRNVDGTEYVKNSKTFGRFKKGQRLVNLQVKGSTTFSTFRCAGLLTFETAGGFYGCNTWQPSNAGQCAYPLYLMDITSIPNFISNTLVGPNPIWRLGATDRSNVGNYNWNVLDVPKSIPFNGSVGPAQWSSENLPATSTASNSSSYPFRRCIQNWTQFKFMLYGALNHATRWRIEEITLNEPWLQPDFVFTGGSAASGQGDYPGQRNAFWDYLVKQFVVGPLEVQNAELRKLYKVHRVICDVIIEPKLTNEPQENPDAAVNLPHQHQQDVFLKQDLLLKYDWNDDGTSGTDNLGYQVNVGQMRTAPETRHRRFIMIRALSPIVNTLATNTANLKYDPTFDMVMRKKITQLN